MKMSTARRYGVALLGVLVMVSAAWADEVSYFANDSLAGSLSYNNPPGQAVFYAGKYDRTYVAYLSHDFYAMVTYYDHDTHQWAEPVQVDDVRTKDGHNNPELLITQDGHLQLFYGCHYHPVKYAWSVYPEDISEWWLGREIGSRATYPNPLQLANGDILLFYRFGKAGANCPLKMHRSTDSGLTWDEGTELVEFGDSRCYIRDILYDAAQNMVYLAITRVRPKSGAKPYSLMYDPATQHLIATNGADLGTLATPEELDASNCRQSNDQIMVDIAGHSQQYRISPAYGRPFLQCSDGHVLEMVAPAHGRGVMYSPDGQQITAYAMVVTDPPTDYEGGDLVVWHRPDGGVPWDDGRVIVARRELGHGIHPAVPVVRNYRGSGPLLIFQENMTDTKSLPRRGGSILDNIPARFHKRLYALDVDYRFVTSIVRH